MQNFINKIQRFLLAIIGIAVVMYALTHVQSYLVHFQHSIIWLSIGALISSFVLASQFNKMRVAYLSLTWCLVMVSFNFSVPWTSWLVDHTAWLIITGCLITSYISFIKDRALLSRHSVKRILVFFTLSAIAWGWLAIEPQLKILAWFHQLPSIYQLPAIVYLPVVVCLFTVSSFSLFSSQATVRLCFVSLWFWVLSSTKIVPVDLVIIALTLAIYFLLMVIIETYLLAYRDELTHLPTRRALNNLSLALSKKYCVAMLDIDHFKKFNDTYGHDIGDQVLKLVASQLKQLKGGGKIFRYGGEEFTVVFPRKSMEHAQHHLEILRQSIADYEMVIRQPVRKGKNDRGKKAKMADKTVSITISIGVAEHESKQAFMATLKLADEALYRAKKSGRNKVSA